MTIVVIFGCQFYYSVCIGYFKVYLLTSRDGMIMIHNGKNLILKINIIRTWLIFILDFD